MPRFHLPLDPSSIGEQLLAKADVLKIELLRVTDDDGNRCVCASYSINGNLDLEDESDPDRALFAELIRQFAKPAGGAL